VCITRGGGKSTLKVELMSHCRSRLVSTARFMINVCFSGLSYAKQ